MSKSVWMLIAFHTFERSEKSTLMQKKYSCTWLFSSVAMVTKLNLHNGKGVLRHVSKSPVVILFD